MTKAVAGGQLAEQALTALRFTSADRSYYRSCLLTDVGICSSADCIL